MDNYCATRRKTNYLTEEDRVEQRTRLAKAHLDQAEHMLHDAEIELREAQHERDIIDLERDL